MLEYMYNILTVLVFGSEVNKQSEPQISFRHINNATISAN